MRFMGSNATGMRWRPGLRCKQTYLHEGSVISALPQLYATTASTNIVVQLLLISLIVGSVLQLWHDRPS